MTNSIVATFGPPIVTGNTIFQRGLSIIESEAYGDQMRRHRFTDMTSELYKQIISRTEAMVAPSSLGNRILQFIYF